MSETQSPQLRPEKSKRNVRSYVIAAGAGALLATVAVGVGVAAKEGQFSKPEAKSIQVQTPSAEPTATIPTPTATEMPTRTPENQGNIELTEFKKDLLEGLEEGEHPQVIALRGVVADVESHEGTHVFVTNPAVGTYEGMVSVAALGDTEEAELGSKIVPIKDGKAQDIITYLPAKDITFFVKDGRLQLQQVRLVQGMSADGMSVTVAEGSSPSDVDTSVLFKDHDSSTPDTADTAIAVIIPADTDRYTKIGQLNGNGYEEQSAAQVERFLKSHQ